MRIEYTQLVQTSLTMYTVDKRLYITKMSFYLIAENRPILPQCSKEGVRSFTDLQTSL